MEYELRYYYPKSDLNYLINKLNNINLLINNGRKYEKTTMYNHPDKSYDFYSKDIDGRFRVRITKSDSDSKCKISWKRRLLDTTKNNINKEEEVELSINYEEYENLLFIINNVLHMNIVSSYERFRTTYTNEEIEIAIDEYPFGIAVEIEVNKKYNDKSNEIIPKYKKLLDLDEKRLYKLSWDDKYEELCKEQNIKVYSEVTFDKEMPEVKKEV